MLLQGVSELDLARTVSLKFHATKHDTLLYNVLMLFPKQTFPRVTGASELTAALEHSF